MFDPIVSLPLNRVEFQKAVKQLREVGYIDYELRARMSPTDVLLVIEEANRRDA